MKKLLMFAAVALLGAVVYAQENESTGGYSNGDVFISGAASYVSESIDDVSENGFSVMPRLGFFVSDNIALGAEVGYGFVQTKFDGDEVGKTDSFSVGAFGRYYATVGNQFSLFGELGFDYVSSEEIDFEFDLGEYKLTGFEIAVAPGISYFVSDNFAIEATVGLLSYSSLKPDFREAEALNTFATGLGFNDINFALNYKF
ncbi:outer membrane beta-barrel protein [Luteirhabdus pelagi]|uniref:outer membrane beta-barrel protein n=1 Tax=Luteirhabdus pelagi TaxID=2792783 RepID=UPI001939B3AE|nr:outer membrane beta-barrel protein [Luteirhabdus pelagi]